MKLCSERLIVAVEIYAKNVKFGHLNSEPIGKVRGETQRWVMVFFGKPMVDFLFALIELFSLSITVSEL